MDNQRVFLWAALAFVLWLNYVTWQKDYAPTPPSPTATAEAPAVAPESLPALPETPAPAAAEAQGTAAGAITAANAPTVHVRTDVLDVTISLRGGELQRAELPRYPIDKQRPDVPVLLFSDQGPDIFLARSGLRAAGGRDEPTHLAMYAAEASEYVLPSGAESLEVPLTWRSADGVLVTKTYVFARGSYSIDLVYEVANESPADWQAASYVQLVRHHRHVERSMFDVETYAYRGPAIYDGSSYRKLDVEDEDDANWTATFAGGWMAALQHHFVAAAVPPENQIYDYVFEVRNSDYVLSYRGPLETAPTGGTARFTETLFVGPKLQEQLATVGPKLELTADYGKLTIISQPLFWLLDRVHDLVGNWGWAIVIVTFLIKLLFYKLTETSGRSMAKMRNLTPRIKNLQERYKDDREALGRAMMEMYKREKINPLAGCLPILIQIPVFLAFYWVLLESVEMRQAPFLGWINDLSSRDPYFILPILMGVAMFGQFKLNPAPPDPMQAKVFAFMPIVMTVMMAWFPAGLVLYWLTNTLLSIAQQWKINKVVETEAKKH